MSKFVSFSVTDGGVVGKARKRLRGDNNRKPEVKKCDFGGSNLFPFWECVCNWQHNVPSTQQLGQFLYNHSPRQIAYPVNGATATTYIGTSIFLKYFRLKGYLVNLGQNPVQIRWRLCLVRIDWSGLDSPSFNTNQYLSLYKPSSILATTSMTDLDSTVKGSAINYYCKQKDVEEWGGIKRVVIATGVLPPATQARGVEAVGGNNLTLLETVYLDRAGYRGYTPIDVKVTLNDRINVAKGNVRYYLVFESDCGLGYPTVGDQAGSSDQKIQGVVDWPTKSPIQIRIQGTTYYTDA